MNTVYVLMEDTPDIIRMLGVYRDKEEADKEALTRPRHRLDILWVEEWKLQ